jgi:class 3 adenylate cyclase/ABC-type branched-subunit amino acid transport system substrate-binding protein/streptogramin lyase/predicted Ser/Thr protein kinase
MTGPLDPGSTVAGYRIEELLGRGGMGVVYRATDLRLERPVALKLITPELAEDDRFRERFLRESKLAASLDHPNVVPIYEAGEAEGRLFLAMRYVEGSDLKDLIVREGPLAPERTLAIAGQVAAALGAAHARGLVHRDVKPGNVLLDEHEHAYLTDFGLTKQVGGASTQTGQLVGTLDYLAPEQIAGQEVDGRTDEYALACLLYECLTGSPPFHRETEAQTLWAQMNESPAPLQSHAALDTVLEKGLAKAKEERYASAEELLVAARHALRLDATEGVATIMFSDVEGSTEFTAKLGDEAARELIEGQRTVVQRCVAEHDGRVIDSIGDGFMIAFDSTRKGLACAIAIQETLRDRAASDPQRAVRLRIGLNVGEVLEREGHPFGAAVNAAARVASQAKGGEVVVSEAVRQLAGTMPGVAFRDRGRIKLKGFDEPWRLYQLAWGEQAAEEPSRIRVPTPPRPRVKLGRRAGAVVLVCVLAAAAAVAALLLTSGGGGTASAAVKPNSVAAIDPSTGKILDSVPVGATPTTVVTGEGAVWTINADDQTISRVDPDTHTARSFGTKSTPTDLAAGEGALWVGNGVERASSAYIGPALTSLSAIDPNTLEVGVTAKVTSPSIGAPLENRIVVGPGAVWVIRSDYTLSRLDPATGRLAATLPDSVRAQALDIGPSGTVWIVAVDGTVQRIDPKTNRVTAKVKVGGTGLSDVAVGGGSIWASDPFDGILWRIDSGPRGFVTRTIEVPDGSDQLAFGEGAAWLLNGFGGSLFRIDPHTNRIAQTIELGNTPRDVAVGEGAVWVTVAGAGGESAPAAGSQDYPDLQTLPATGCGKVFYGGDGDPQYLIASDLPLRGGSRTPTLAMSQAIGFVMRQHRFRAGKFRIAYQSCDDSTAQAGIFDPAKCAANARTFAATTSVIGVVGTFNSECAYEEIPILNRAKDGPLGMVSPSNSDPGLTRGGRFGSSPADLRRLYPNGRSFVRVYSTDDAQGAAAALLANQLGIHKPYLVRGNDGYTRLIGDAFVQTARKLGLTIGGSSGWDPLAKSYADVADRVARSGADGAMVGVGLYEGNAGQLIKALRLRLGADFPLFGPDALLPVSTLFDTAGPSARGLYISLGGLTTDHLSPAGRRFVKEFGATQPGGEVDPFAVYAAQATEVLLDAIGRSDGTRRSVVKQLFRTRVKNGILGSFRFDENGDTTSIPLTIVRAERGGGAKVMLGLEGASFDHVVQVPSALLK